MLKPGGATLQRMFRLNTYLRRPHRQPSQPFSATCGELSFTLSCATLLPAQNNWFQPSILKQPELAKAFRSVDDRYAAIVDEWVRLAFRQRRCRLVDHDAPAAPFRHF